jgi:hypothetical protein
LKVKGKCGQWVREPGWVDIATLGAVGVIENVANLLAVGSALLAGSASAAGVTSAGSNSPCVARRLSVC